ncbi:flagellar hook capping FlgD N-terminal domain-containing protein [Herbivorax sp. ANBcel31]|uniref:flagellar hook capping FlgD N-terminal domain-containing protein n=1 Tax=Herbivorax sp. ANBcel31 TaxID=3069754 RepID=UPI0027B144BB|nr:flagellar hook capping FlgD N-terminal domain-containing protein [Herbivorax sp. ANBcel31]MDQ2085890.1 flagellar hook capping FlgD N-terminal domain-containing protein [Herbivorax sp. ANBcel31]
MSVNGVEHQKTLQDIIDSTENRVEERNTDELGKDDFLNLLITQLSHQDPMNPVEDKEFIAQMAQFSSLEQMQNMNSGFSQIKAFSMIGKNITADVINQTSNEKEVVEGRVDSVSIESGKTVLDVNGRDVPVDRVRSVEGESEIYNDEGISQYTGLIGHKVDGVLYDASTTDMVGVTGVVKEIQKGMNENYGVMDEVSVNVASIDTEFSATNPEFRTDYLTNNLGQQVNLIVSDDTGNEVPVTGLLNSFDVEESGRITAVLNQVQVSVDSINSIKEKPGGSLGEEGEGE